MPHPRQAIREAIRSILDAAPTLTGRVFTTRTRPTQVDELPCVIIYALSEESDQIATDGDLFRTLTVGVEVRAANTETIDDVLDDLCIIVEAQMSSDPSLNGEADNATLTSTVIGLDGEGESRQGVATLTYRTSYFTDGTAV